MMLEKENTITDDLDEEKNELELNEDTIIIGLIKRTINGDIIYFEYSNDFKELLSIILNEYVSTHLDNLNNLDYQKKVPIEEIEFLKNDIFKHIHFLKDYYKDNKIIKNYLHLVKEMALYSYTIKTRDAFDKFILKINYFLFGDSYDEIIIFDNLSDVVNYLKTYSATYKDDAKKILDETFYLNR